MMAVPARRLDCRGEGGDVGLVCEEESHPAARLPPLGGERQTALARRRLPPPIRGRSTSSGRGRPAALGMPLGGWRGTGEGAAASVPRGRPAMNESTAPRALTRGDLFVRNNHLEGGGSDLSPSVSFLDASGRVPPLLRQESGGTTERSATARLSRPTVLPASDPRRSRPEPSRVAGGGAHASPRDTDQVGRTPLGDSGIRRPLWPRVGLEQRDTRTQQSTLLQRSLNFIHSEAFGSELGRVLNCQGRDDQDWMNYAQRRIKKTLIGRLAFGHADRAD